VDVEIEAARALARASSVLERSSAELSLAQYRILTAIASGQTRASQVADRLALSRATVSGALDSFVRRGLVTRSEVVSDQRAAELRLTAGGEHLLARVDDEMRARIRDLARRTPDPARLLESLVWLGRAVDERRAEKYAEHPGPVPPPARRA
jgi:DNA-binding MarR family transcriptional regulator